jgi:phytoene dehydrogenase-like protein
MRRPSSSDASWSRREILAAAGLAGLAALAPEDAHAEVKWGHSRREVVVLGSGIGGMAAGALLARQGHQVTVLERHPTRIGGLARTLHADGVAYGLGPQYVWQFGEGDLGQRFLAALGIDGDNPFRPMDPDGFEGVVLGGRVGGPLRFDVPSGFDRYRDRLCERFPVERRAIADLFDELAPVGAAMQTVVHGDLMGPSGLGTTARVLLSGDLGLRDKRLLSGLLRRSVGDWFDRHRVPEDVRRIVYGSSILAEHPRDASALAFAYTVGAYHHAAHVPVAGFDALFDSLRDCIVAAGGTVRCGSEGVRVAARGRKVEAVHCADGTEVPCDTVLSCLSPRLTAALVDGAKPHRYHYPPSASILTVCLGFAPEARVAERSVGRNLWWYDRDAQPDFFAGDVTGPLKMVYAAPARATGDPGGTEGLVCFCPSHVDQEAAIDADPARARAFREDLAPGAGGPRGRGAARHRAAPAVRHASPPRARR